MREKIGAEECIIFNVVLMAMVKTIGHQLQYTGPLALCLVDLHDLVWWLPL